LNSKSVHAFDLDEKSTLVAAKRCQLLNVTNVEIFTRDTSWIDAYLEHPRSLSPSRPDVIFCYALLEHLVPIERLKFLEAAWNDLNIGGHILIVECPNRLHWFDWHSTMLPFSDWLPEDIVLLWNARSERPNIWSSIKPNNLSELRDVDRSQLYRFGRGCSFHEFELAIGLDRLTITAGPHSEKAIYRGNLPGYDQAWEEAIAAKLQGVTPPVHQAFAACCLDLILTKTS